MSDTTPIDRKQITLEFGRPREMIRRLLLQPDATEVLRERMASYLYDHDRGDTFIRRPDALRDPAHREGLESAMDKPSKKEGRLPPG